MFCLFNIGGGRKKGSGFQTVSALYRVRKILNIFEKESFFSFFYIFRYFNIFYMTRI